MTEAVILAALALALGGFLKGATGAGTPIVAVPVLAMLFDVPTAIVVMLVPNLVSNLWQWRAYRAHLLPRRFLWLFAGSGVVGAAAGTVLLATLPARALLALMALAVALFLLRRLTRPDWRLRYRRGLRLAAPAGLVAGVLQGATGISAPVSISFLSAMRPARRRFIASISVFFLCMTLPQMPLLAHYGFLDAPRLAASVLALLPIGAGLWAGTLAARRLSRRTFEVAILALLALVAVKLALDAAWPGWL